MKERSMRKKQRGNVFIETALAFVILCPIFLWTFQFGLAFVYYNQLASAVRSGARFAANRTYASSTSTPTTTYISEVRNVVVYGDPSGGTSPLVVGLAPSNVTINVLFDKSVPSAVTVSISNFTMNLIVRSLRISKPSVTFPYSGHYAPPV